MMIKKIIAFFSILLISYFSYGQDSDFGIWTEINASRKVTGKLRGELSVSVRSFENSSKVEQLFGEAALSYKFNDFLSAATSYRLVSALEDDALYHFTHKFFFDLKASIKAGDFGLSARARMQIANRTYLESPTDDPFRYYARLKVKGVYDIPAFRFNPFLSYEPFVPVARGNGFEISKYRISAGTEVKISEKSSLEAGYIFEHDTRPDNINNNIITVGWNLKF